MVKSVENGVALPPFLVKCYEMVNDESTNDLISWSESNDSFFIWDESRFSSQMLPKYFKHNNFSSFVRQLNIYGFRKIDTDNWQFSNEFFVKGQKHLLRNITRRKQLPNPSQKKPPMHNPDVEPTPQSSEEDRKIALWREVETLKTDKTALTQELKKLSQHQQSSESKMLTLREQLKGMERNQQQMLSFIVMAMQSPEFMVQFFQPKENTWREKNGTTKLSEVIDDCTASDGALVRYQPEASKPEDYLMGLDFTPDEIGELFMDIDLLLSPRVDERLHSVENQGEFVLPEASEHDNMLEQLLLPYPPTEDRHLEAEAEAEACNKESELSGGSIDDIGECRNEDVDDDVMEDSSGRVEALTGKMEFLISEMRSLEQ